ncbi:MAG: alpha/beta hydrolase [Proteobacteria bacterium]|nr:alpha/beta hydrolase [Pseudomonadota bacterium]
MANVQANGIRIEYDTFGDRSGRPLLMVMGLGAQMIHWRAEFCEQLADAGHYVVRFDNRDVGLSSKFEAAGLPDMAAIMGQMAAGQPISAPYSLDDMADDAFGLLDALDIPRAHICGASMGGMIVQAMAIRAPRRVHSLTSIMSSTGNRELPPAKPEAMAALMSPAGTNRSEMLARSISVSKVIGSPGYPADPAEVETRALEAYERSFYPVGVARQMVAVASHGNRKSALQQLDIPALVIHGQADPLVPVEGGIDTHEALRGSQLMLIEGMGHDLPRQVWPRIVTGITRLTSTAR